MSKNASTVLALSAAALFLGGCDNKDAPPTTAPGVETPAGDDGAAAADAGAADGGEQASADGDKKIKCFGANDCSGQAACDVPDGRVEEGSKGHACAGQNACKGKGWVLLAQADCTEKGGEPL